MKELVRELRMEKVGRGTPGILPYHVARMLHLFLLEYPAGLKLLLETFTSGEAFFLLVIQLMGLRIRKL